MIRSHFSQVASRVLKGVSERENEQQLKGKDSRPLPVSSMGHGLLSTETLQSHLMLYKKNITMEERWPLQRDSYPPNPV